MSKLDSTASHAVPGVPPLKTVWARRSLEYPILLLRGVYIQTGERFSFPLTAFQALPRTNIVQVRHQTTEDGSCHEFHQQQQCKERPCRSLEQSSASLPFSKAENAHCFGFWDAVVLAQITISPGFHIASTTPHSRQILRHSRLKIPAKG
jgi:hypothetical protein